MIKRNYDEKSNFFMFDVYLCDKCEKIVGASSHGAFRAKFGRDPDFIHEKTKKGVALHFCNEECCRAHRGHNAGKGRLWSNGFIWTREALKDRRWTDERIDQYHKEKGGDR